VKAAAEWDKSIYGKEYGKGESPNPNKNRHFHGVKDTRLHLLIYIKFMFENCAASAGWQLLKSTRKCHRRASANHSKIMT